MVWKKTNSALRSVSTISTKTKLNEKFALLFYVFYNRWYIQRIFLYIAINISEGKTRIYSMDGKIQNKRPVSGSQMLLIPSKMENIFWHYPKNKSPKLEFFKGESMSFVWNTRGLVYSCFKQHIRTKAIE